MTTYTPFQGTSISTRDEISAAADILGAAFVHDPFMSALVDRRSHPASTLSGLMRPVIHACVQLGNAELAANRAGTLGWIAGKHLPLGLWSLIRSGLIWTPKTLGLSAFKRLEDHEQDCERHVLANAPEGFAYIWVLGVCAAARGQGIGKQLVQSALDQMRDRGHTACLLRTDNAKNVPFYQKLGFEPVYAGTVATSGLPTWILFQTL